MYDGCGGGGRDRTAAFVAGAHRIEMDSTDPSDHAEGDGRREFVSRRVSDVSSRREGPHLPQNAKLCRRTKKSGQKLIVAA